MIPPLSARGLVAQFLSEARSGVAALVAASRRSAAQFGAYHGAKTTPSRDFTTSGFGTGPRPESDYLTRYDRAKIIARSRIGIRNNPYLAALLKAYVLEIGTPTLKSQTGDELYDDAKERLFERWARDCEAEHDLSLEEVIEIYNYEDCIAGELFVIKRREGWLQLIPSELCGSTFTQSQAVPAGSKFADGSAVPAGVTECDGILRDSSKFVIGYRFGKRTEWGNADFTPEASTIVQSQYVWHLYSPDRIEQGRGVPLLAPVMNALQDVFETAEARAQQVKNASCLSMWITKNIDPNGFAEAMRGAFRGDSAQNALALKEIAETRSTYQDIRKGSIYYGAVGEDLRLIEPKLQAADFHDHYIDLLQVCSACLNGMPVEIGLEGFRASNYSSARATVNKWKRNVRRIRRRLETKFLDPLQLWQVNRARLFEDIGPAPAAAADSATHNTDENVFWGWPAIPDIDGLKTTEQAIKEYAAGMTTLEEIYADKGQHADVQIKRWVADKTRLAKAMRKAALDAGLSSSAADQIAAGYLANEQSSVVTATSTIDDKGGGEPPAGSPSTNLPAE